ncbi:hypothetical protein HMPREF3213_02140 [Heyndrickxia coagulans]|uniref:Uncharacterized protein n=1 Tax=Heyndrickxia coagulans TaxID=1398 RepID=A0A133KNF8_HEYCO|nr:hypothetical protein HMPREF3213_02140 [Heyndrickxia coagulans]
MMIKSFFAFFPGIFGKNRSPDWELNNRTNHHRKKPAPLYTSK